jgi:hypothetical protein
MFRPRYLPGLLVAVMACSDTPTSSFAGTYVPSEPDDGFREISGYVMSSTELLAEDGTTIRMGGPQTELLNGLVGAEIRVRGTPDELGSTDLWIVEFRVLFVDDLPAFDGVLEEIDGNFAINHDEEFTMIADAPEDLASHVGKRVWLTLRDGALVRYGLLEM